MCFSCCLLFAPNSNTSFSWIQDLATRGDSVILKKQCEKINKDVIEAILGFHAFTGCDTTSAFVRKGKCRPLKLMMKNPRFIALFKSIGCSETVSDEDFEQLQKLFDICMGSHHTPVRINCALTLHVKSLCPRDEAPCRVAMDLTSVYFPHVKML